MTEPIDPELIDPELIDTAPIDPELIDPETDVGGAGADPVADDPVHASEQVAAALAELDAAAERPPADQVAAFIAAHEALQASLARIDDH